MDNTLARILCAVKGGGSISDSEYYHLMNTAKNGVPKDAADAQAILRTYNYYSERPDYYKYLGDPMDNVTNRNTSDENTYGRLGDKIF